MIIPAKPIPQPTDDLSQPYWEAAIEGRLVLQQCASCGKLRHYPRLLCDACWSSAVVWKESSRRGRVHSWMVAHHAFHPGFASDLPYTLVTVDLDEGVCALGRWLGGGPLAIGAPVQGRFVARDGASDLVFEPA